MPSATTPTALAVNDFVARSGLFGVAVIDAGGQVTERYGALVAHVDLGEHVEDAFPFLIGFEEDLEEVLRGDRTHVQVSNMNLTLSDGRLVFASVFLAAGPVEGTTTVILQDTTEASETHRKMMQQRNDLDIARRQLEDANEALRQRGEELRAAREKAEDATVAKSRFLAMMSHEIRTPMNGVLGMLQLLDDGELSGEKQAYASTARGSAEALVQIIGDILDFSKIEAGRLDVERIPFDPRSLTESVVTLLQPRAGEQGTGLVCTVDESIRSAVLGDPGRCRQILLNLVGNAVKFTERGSVTVTLDRVPTAADRLRFAVADTGIGISEEARGRLFTEFTQSDASTTRRFGGTGLGLAISKRLVELMGGTIGVESVQGEGSVFWFELPLESTDEAPLTDQAIDLPTNVTGARLLLADDALANRQVAVAMLGKADYEVDIAVDGREAVDKALAGGYDLILMDLNMPEMDGVEATATLREAGLGVPILAMTAHTADELGPLPDFDGHIGKPVRREVLLRTVAEALDGVSPASGGSAPGQGPTEAGSLPPDEEATSVFDRGILSGFLDDVGASVFRELVDTYIAETRRRVDGLLEELDAGRLDVVERYAHDIKSCAGALGAKALRDGAGALEAMAPRADQSEVEGQARLVIDGADQVLPMVEEATAALLTE